MKAITREENQVYDGEPAPARALHQDDLRAATRQGRQIKSSMLPAPARALHQDDLRAATRQG